MSELGHFSHAERLDPRQLNLQLLPYECSAMRGELVPEADTTAESIDHLVGADQKVSRIVRPSAWRF
jgi:hypothetical protein